MAKTLAEATETVSFATHPDRYRHWRLEIEGEVATLWMDVREDKPLREGYALKLNSYDLGVDIELADAVERMRFEHPEVKVVVIRSAKDRVFSAGANIHMLGLSPHGFKINFCKFTNETRLAIEDASRSSGMKFLAALNGVTAGGGYELALACDDLVLVDDGSSAVSLPEVALLGVLPGTGGLTRVVDKRGVRRDHADIFCTLQEGVRGQRAVDWKLVDATAPRSKFEEVLTERGRALAGKATPRSGPGVVLEPLEIEASDDRRRYKYVTLDIVRNQRTATLTVRGPEPGEPETSAALRERGSDVWSLRAFRELDDALLHLRFNEETIGLVAIKTTGDSDRVLAADRVLDALRSDWFAREILLYQARVLRRLDLTARSFFALIEPGSCFAGSLFELALASDRSYVLDMPEIRMALGPLNAEDYPMSHGLSRLEAHFSGDESRVEAALYQGTFNPEEADAAGLVTARLDEIDYEDEVRVAIEERASLSPDALTGMEASLRFPGLETAEAKIFGRLSAWQNWIFFRPNAVGEHGALKVYGKPERASFDWKRT
ncbi:MAG TPA: 2,3-epoxybenzoyl-CoA dihydrolase [Candidatus Eisenbacteria bacterium]|nr:2,3-epoxybenzoyl-CoA dihydrolase [Candidatus Eisenbacteria bacterium]